jgi:D-arginine dehydrogenase
MERCDFLVVGAGIAGASAAYELAASGRVIVLERESQPGYHTTGRSAAQFLETYGNNVVRGLTRASRAFFFMPPEGFTEQHLLSARPALYIARKDQLESLARFEDGVRRLTPSVERLSAARTLEIVPVLKETYVASSVIEPEATDVDVHALHQGYLKGLRQRGGKVATNAEVTALSKSRGMWNAETSVGAFSAPVVVNAAGAWCDEVARQASVRPCGLVPKRRTAFTVDPPAGVDISAWPLTIDIDEQFYFKPESGLILLSPADETPSPPCDSRPEDIDVALAVDRLQTATTLTVPRIAHKWAGLRSFVADKTPVLGMDNEAGGFFWLAGQGGYGIQTAPAMARAAAALITSGALPEDFAEQDLRESDLAPRRLR